MSARSAHLDDARVRLAAFDFLKRRTEELGEVLPFNLLRQGFVYEGRRVPLASAQGIFKPAVLPLVPLTIATTPRSPYRDRMGADGLITYSYRGTDPFHRDNTGLREAMRRRTPLIYLYGVAPNRYVPVWPVFVVGDDPARLEFRVAADDPDLARRSLAPGSRVAEADEENEISRRLYITGRVRLRLHQRAFRDRVLEAYRETCALCRLRHAELLDAAHIIPDGQARGDPVVENGIALCKLHHAAFDGFFIGIRPNYRIEVRRDILEEEDGPMLLHGLKALHGAEILLPRRERLRPDPARLETRYDRFRQRQSALA